MIIVLLLIIANGFGFEVMDMDWRRVDKVLLTPHNDNQGEEADE